MHRTNKTLLLLIGSTIALHLEGVPMAYSQPTWSYAGDGATEAAGGATPGTTAGGGGHLGAATWSTAIESYAHSLIRPQLSINYSSEAPSSPEFATKGWSVGGICTIARKMGVDEFSYPTPATRISTENFDISCPGFSGTLVHQPPGVPHQYQLRSTTGLRVYADYSHAQDVWKVFTKTRTFHLHPADRGTALGLSTVSWRVKYEHDPRGNAIEYFYDATQAFRLTAVEYGFQCDLLDPSRRRSWTHGRTEFSYAASPSTFVSYLGGFKTASSGNLSQIHVHGRGNSVSGPLVYRYEISYATVDQLSKVTKVVLQSSAGDLREVIGEFSYYELGQSSSDYVPKLINDDDPDSLSAQGLDGPMATAYSTTDRDGRTGATETITYTRTILIDFNGDGLIDKLTGPGATGSTWSVRIQEPMPSEHGLIAGIENASTYRLAPARQFSGPAVPISKVITHSNPANINHNLTEIKSILLHVDNDGYPDLIEYGAPPRSGSFVPTWRVYYGNGRGFESARTESGPMTNFYLRGRNLGVGWAPSAEKMVADTDYDVDTADTAFADINNDGWVDFIDFSRGNIFYHGGVRGRGWGGSPRSFDTRYVDAGSSIEAIVQTVSLAGDGHRRCLSTHWDHITHTDVQKGLVDLNGDGLVDFVDASSLPWRVHFGTGDGFETSRAHLWSAPHTAISGGYSGSMYFQFSGLPSECGERLNLDDYGTSMLYDVNRDGLPDYVDLNNRRFHPNLGDGFGNGNPLPSFSPLREANKKANTHHVSTTNATALGTGFLGDMSTYFHAGWSDLNGDGILDFANGFSTVLSRYVPYGKLKRVENGRGLRTDYSYLPSTLNYPSGEDQAHETPFVRDMVWQIERRDEVTSGFGTFKSDFDVRYVYKNGTMDAYKFLGYDKLEIHQTEWVDGVLKKLSQSEVQFELSEEFGPLVVKQSTTHPDGSVLEGDAYFNRDSIVEHRYREILSGIFKVLTDTVTTREFRDPHKTEYRYDTRSRLSHIHTGQPSCTVLTCTIPSGNRTTTRIGYTANANQTFYWERQREQFVYTPSSVKFGDVRYFYDGASSNTAPIGLYGEVTMVQSDVGCIDCTEAPNGLASETQRFELERGFHGELAAVRYPSYTDSEGTTITPEVRYFYDSTGSQLLSEIDHHGLVTSYSYDLVGNLSTKIYPNHASEQYNYDGLNRLVEVLRTPNVQTTSYKLISSTEYHEAEKPYNTTPRLVKVTQYNQDPAPGTGGFPGSSHPDGTSYTYYDGLDRPIQLYRPSNDPTTGNKHFLENRRYDPLGNLLYTTWPRSTEYLSDQFQDRYAFNIHFTRKKTHNFYDKQKRLTKVCHDYSGSTTDCVDYDYSERRQPLITTPDGFVKKFAYDIEGRLTDVYQGDDPTDLVHVGRYTYKPFGPLHRVEFLGDTTNRKTYEYDGLGRIREYSEQNALLKNYKYNGPYLASVYNGASTSAAAQRYYYDDRGRPDYTSITDPSSTSGHITYRNVYDDANIYRLGSLVDLEVFDANFDEVTRQLVGNTIAQYVTTLDYDAWGRTKSVSQTHSGRGSGVAAPVIVGGVVAIGGASSSSNEVKFEVMRDLSGQVVRSTFPSGTRVEHGYDQGWLVSQTFTSSAASPISLGYSHNVRGNLTRVESNHGFTYSMNYGGFANRLQSSNLRLHMAPVAHRSFDYSKDGYITRKQLDAAGTSVQTMTYDRLAQLTRIKDGGGALREAFTYDGNGNLTQHTLPDGSVVNFTQYSASHALELKTVAGVQHKYTYSQGKRSTFDDEYLGAGDTDIKHQYEYDGMDRLVLVKDGSGQVLQRIIRGPRGEVLERRYDDQSGSGLRSIYYAGTWKEDEINDETVEYHSPYHLRVKTGTTTSNRWLFKDIDGSLVAAFDDFGVQTSDQDLLAYGAINNQTGEEHAAFSVHGLLRGPIDGLHEAGLRVFDGDGHWLQPEPLYGEGFSSQHLRDPLRFMAYRYARNNPMNFKDPSGYIVISSTVLIGAGIVLGTAAVAGLAFLIETINANVQAQRRQDEFCRQNPGACEDTDVDGQPPAANPGGPVRQAPTGNTGNNNRSRPPRPNYASRSQAQLLRNVLPDLVGSIQMPNLSNRFGDSLLAANGIGELGGLAGGEDETLYVGISFDKSSGAFQYLPGPEWLGLGNELSTDVWGADYVGVGWGLYVDLQSHYPYIVEAGGFQTQVEGRGFQFGASSNVFFGFQETDTFEGYLFTRGFTSPVPYAYVDFDAVLMGPVDDPYGLNVTFGGGADFSFGPYWQHSYTTKDPWFEASRWFNWLY